MAKNRNGNSKKDILIPDGRDTVIYKGRIIKAISGFFYVYSDEAGLIECHGKGNLRKGSYRPVVGDMVTFEIVPDSEGDCYGSIISVLERKTSLIRPEVANVDQALIVFAYENPEPNILLLDRFLVMLEKQDVNIILCFNKLDIAEDSKKQKILEIYRDCGFQVIEVSATNDEGIDKVRDILKNKITAFAGPSGVGKSSLINALCLQEMMETGEISRKTERGKHTTRHSQIFALEGNNYIDGTCIMDTPGFTAVELMEGMDCEELRMYYREFFPYEGGCKYDACSHTHEPSCAVKEAVEQGAIHKIRYENYCQLYSELKNRRKY